MLSAAVLAIPGAGRAQMHHVEAPQKVTRAIGVYEWTGELSKPAASRFVPVSLFINGRFEDAGLYLARPVPFALQSGDLYTVERSGEPQGEFDLDMAERVVSGNALRDDNPAGTWYGFGKYTAEAPPKPPPPLHHSAHVGVIQGSTTGTTPAGTADDDKEPHMSRRGAPTDSGSADKPAAGDSSDSKDAKAPSYNSGGDDTDRPTLARRDPAQDANRRKVTGGKGGTASVAAVGPAPGDDPDRPNLSHHISGDEGPKPLTGLPADLHQAVAVSDAASHDPHPFARPWEGPADRSTTLAAMEALARPLVAGYLKENRLIPAVPAPEAAEPKPAASTEGTAANTENGSGAAPRLQRGRPTEYGQDEAAPVAKPPARTAGTRRPPAKAQRSVPLTLREPQIQGFTLSYGGLPTFVYTAVASTSAKEPGDLPAGAARPVVYVTVIAQRLPSGELQTSLGDVTDSAHLDRGPRFRLIDAVDPDGSHRGSLLFELRGTGSRQFALYRLTTARAENTFTSASIE